MRKKRVVHLMSTHAFSGAENVACQIINAFKNDEDYEMIYVSEIKENKQNLDDRNINYYNLNRFSKKNVCRAIKELKPDIIHAHDAKAIVMASKFNRKAKIVGQIHGNHENMRKLTIKTFLLNFITKKVSKFIWVSDSSLNDYYYKEKIQDKSVVIRNVIDSEQLLAKINDDNKYPSFDIIYLGRLSYPKNPVRLIEIIGIVKKYIPNVKVAIVGSGELEQDVLNKINELGLKSNIIMFGFSNNPYKILNSSKLMLMTSRYEGTPMCALEAMALGKVIVSTPTDGLVDVIEHGKTGYYSDDNNKLCKYIVSLLEDNDKLKEMENNVLKKSQMINDIKKYELKIKKIYDEV